MDNEIIKKFSEFFDCDYDYFSPKSSYDEISNKFYEYLEEGRNNYIPLIVTVSQGLLESLYANSCENKKFNLEELRKNRDITLKTPVLNGKKILDRLLIETKVNFTEEDLFLGEAEGLNSPIGILDDESKGIFIVKVPVKYPWEIFAWLPIGNWNNCPDTSEIIAVSKYRFEKNGAIPLTITSDVLQFRLNQSLNNKGEALETALEMYGFCSDIVDQGIGTVGSLANVLIKSTIWYFWWD